MNCRLAMRLMVLTALWCVVGMLLAQTAGIRHTVVRGETLYRLSVKYGVNVDQLLRCNPGLTASTLKEGMTIVVPTTVQEGDNRQAPVPTVRYELHKLKRKETLWSISQAYGITVDELKAANPDLAPDYKLKRGKMIRIPIVTAEPAATKQSVAAEATANKIKVGIVLPFEASGIAGARCVEFYRGFLMAADVLRRHGRVIEIYAQNEPSSGEEVQGCLRRLGEASIDLLVGPLYLTHFDAFMKFSAAHDVPTVIPFSSKVQGLDAFDKVMLLNAPEECEWQLAIDLFCRQFARYKVAFMLDNQGNALNFMHQLRSALLKQGTKVVDLLPGATVDDMQSVCDGGEPTIFVPAGKDDATYRRLATRVAALRRKQGGGDVALFGYPEWFTSSVVTAGELHAANAYIFASSYYNPQLTDIASFERTYKEWFDSPLLDATPCMALLGYDCANALIEGLIVGGKDFAETHAQVHSDYYSPLQSDMRFTRWTKKGGFVNQSMMLVHFASDGSIEKILNAND